MQQQPARALTELVLDERRALPALLAQQHDGVGVHPPQRQQVVPDDVTAELAVCNVDSVLRERWLSASLAFAESWCE